MVVDVRQRFASWCQGKRGERGVGRGRRRRGRKRRICKRAGAERCTTGARSSKGEEWRG